MFGIEQTIFSPTSLTNKKIAYSEKRELEVKKLSPKMSAERVLSEGEKFGGIFRWSNWKYSGVWRRHVQNLKGVGWAISEMPLVKNRVSRWSESKKSHIQIVGKNERRKKHFEFWTAWRFFPGLSL